MDKKSERGSVTEIVIIIILLLAVAGLVAWRFMGNGSKNISTDSSKTSVSTTNQYYEIKEWGVKVKLDSLADKVTVSVSNDPGSIANVNFDGSAVPSFQKQYIHDVSCGPGLTLFRSAQSQNDSKKIGQYYYFINGGPAPCVNSSDNQLETQFVTMFTLQNIEAL